MEDINKLLNEAQAAAAREAAVRWEQERQAALEAAQAEAAEVAEPLPEGTGTLVVAREQGTWRCSLCERRVRSGDAIEVYINAAIGWVAGHLRWARSPQTPPSLRVSATTAAGADIGEVELLLPEDAVCRWPSG